MGVSHLVSGRVAGGVLPRHWGLGIGTRRFISRWVVAAGILTLDFAWLYFDCVLIYCFWVVVSLLKN